MTYLTQIQFPTDDTETSYIFSFKRNTHDSYYPFQVLSGKGLLQLDFEPITILYGGNGCGKSTALNIIAEKLNLQRDSLFNKTDFYADYVKMCKVETADKIPKNSRILTSDDVFDYMINVRTLNEGIDQKRADLFEDYLSAKYSKFQMQSMDDYDQLKKVVKTRSRTQSKYVREELMQNIREFSNGESAFIYFTERMGENGLYILDEPENSLSPARQLELAKFIEDSVRFFGCQIIMSTHSPFLLGMREAKIYNMDERPVAVRKWTELENIKIYRDFFRALENNT
ncbi:MAG: AAA family ATPase [Defluviitaleaceae bacterium]|nr:AAA family ATPase [Defluviitaleaceae bacterium]